MIVMLRNYSTITACILKIRIMLSLSVNLEDFFKINLVAYEWEERFVKLVQRSRELYSETMRLNIWKNHSSLIVDVEHHCNRYQCIYCGKL